MYKVYRIVSDLTPRVYIGYTKQELRSRMNDHRFCCRDESKTSFLYNVMRKYGEFNFKIHLISEFSSKEEAIAEEIRLIADSDKKVSMNLAPGGNGGYVVPESKKADWISKLKQARKGRTPAKGMKHSEENKRLFAEVSNEYWATQETYKWDDVKHLSHRDAKKATGISTTHYYRLKKRAENNDLS